MQKIISDPKDDIYGLTPRETMKPREIPTKQNKIRIGHLSVNSDTIS